MPPLFDHFSQMHGQSSDSTSHSLLQCVQQRDPDAWRRFAALYGPIVYRWSIRYGLQPHDAADVTQETFQSVAQSIDRFERRSADDSFRGWLWTITRNKIRDHFRRHQKEPRAAGGSAAHDQLQQTPSLPEKNDDSSEAVATELAHRALRLIQSEFEPNTWRAFWATAVDARRADEVAGELGLTLAAVYKAKSRVLLRLRRELEGLLD